MNSLRSLLFLLLALVFLGDAPRALPLGIPRPAQDEESAPVALPESVDEALAIDEADLEEAIQDLNALELQQWLERWMELVRRQDAAFRSAATAEEGSEERQAAERLGTDRDSLIEQAELLITAVLDAGGTVDTARQTIASMHQEELEDLGTVSTVPTDESKARDLSVEVLAARVRPLTKDQVEEQLALWLALLQHKSMEVRNVEVSAMESEDPDEVARYNERAVELRGDRDRLIKRVEVVIDALEDKNGDVEDARAYVDSVVVTPPPSGLRATWSTARAWLMSPDGGIALGKRIGRAIAAMLVFWLLSRLLARFAERAMKTLKGGSDLLHQFVAGSVGRVVFFLGFLVAAHQLGLNMGPLLAVIGAAGLVIGLALQGTLSNFASGLFIMVYRPFDVGDFVETSGTKGKVEGMTLVTTLIRTVDNQSVYVPNNMVWGDVITNLTANETRRVDMVFGIGYGDDVDHAREVLMELAKAHDKVLDDPAPVVEVGALGDSSVDLIVRPWTKTEDYWTVFWDLTREVKKRFDEEEITIPFPQRDVHVYGTAPRSDGDLLPPDRAESESSRDEAVKV